MAHTLKRYQRETENISADGDFKPHTRDICKQDHVVNKPYPICKHQKGILENMNWPKGTYFTIEEVK